MALYRLRPGLRIERDATGTVQVVDAELRRMLRLGANDARVVLALQAGATAAQLAKAARLPADEVAARLTGLARLYLLQGRRTQRRLALQAEATAFAERCRQPATAEPILWPPGRDPPRHACQGTGTCCGATFLGPLTPADRKRVEALRFGSRVRHGVVQRLGPGVEPVDPVVFETAQVGGKDHLGMARGEDGRCVAQGDDHLCDIHREHGADAKPVACRLFPLRFHRSPLGVHVSLILACDGYERARAPGPAWPSRQDEVRALLSEGAPTVKLSAPVELAAGVPVAVGEWAALSARWFALEPAEPDGRGWLAQVVAATAQLVGENAEALAEGPELAAPADLGRAATALAMAQPLYDDDAAAAYADALEARAGELRAGRRHHDAERLTDLAAGVRAQLRDGRLAEGARAFAPLARLHIHDVVANDLAAFVAIGPIDVGLRALVRRVTLVEALACVLADRANRSTVTAADTTRALHVAYRSEPDLAALAACEAA